MPVTKKLLSKQGTPVTPKLYAWGFNYEGMLNDPTLIGSSYPMLIEGTRSWSTVIGAHQKALYAIDSTGSAWVSGMNPRPSPVTRTLVSVIGGEADTDGMAFALDKDGFIYQWGTRAGQQYTAPYDYYLLGWGNGAVARLVPNRLAYMGSSWVTIGKGSAIKADGSLWVWGNDPIGLAQGDLVHRSSPVQIAGSWVAIAGTSSVKYAIKSDGTLWGWGYNTVGQLGLGGTDIAQSWNAVAGGNAGAIAIRADNTLWSWGNNTHGQLGVNDRVHRSSPVQIGTSSWIAIAMTQGTAFAIKTDNTLWAWGRNDVGQLGQSDVIHRSSPVQIPGSWSTIKATRNGTVFGAALGIRTDGTLWGWGYDFYGSAWNNAAVTTYRSSPVSVDGGNSWTKVFADNNKVARIRSDGTLWVTGYQVYGELGTGDNASKTSPTQIPGSWTSVLSQRDNMYGIKSDKTLWGWGRQDTVSNIQLGEGIDTPSSWASISVGLFHTVARRSDGTLWTWGWNSYGTLGNNTVIHRSSPIQIGTSSWLSVSAGGYLSAAIRYDNTLWTWGEGIYGNLGDNSVAYRSSPVQVPGSWTSVAVNYASVAAIRTDGTLWTWGSPSTGQLGLDDTVYRSSPAQVGSSSWSAVFASKYQLNGATYHAIRTDGSLFAWGLNTNGILGDGTTSNRSSPVQIPGSWSYVSCSDNIHTLGIRADGTLWAWGTNTSGQLGLNDTVHRSSPTQVGTSSWAHVQAAQSRTYAIKAGGTLWAWGSLQFAPHGTIGDNVALQSFSSPVQVDTSAYTTSIQTIEAGTSRNYILGSDSLLYGWGLNTTGQLGINTITNRTFPVVIQSYTAGGVNRSSPVQLASHKSDWAGFLEGEGDQTGVIAVDERNTLYHWSFTFNTYYEPSFTQATFGSRVPIPTRMNNRIDNTVKGVTQTETTGTTHIIKQDGTMRGIGLNTNGDVGDRSTVSRSSPTFIGGLWGPVLSPVQVAGGSWTTVAYIKPGGSSSDWSSAAGIKTDGTLWVWGGNTLGQLGLNDRAHRSSPVQISGSWSSVAGGNNVIGAIKSNGTLWMWGTNADGNLGDGTTIHRSSPVQVPGSWSQVAMNHGGINPGLVTVATDSTGVLYAWGSNRYNQLGEYLSLTPETTWSKATIARNSMLLANKTDGSTWYKGFNTNYFEGWSPWGAVNSLTPVKTPDSWTVLKVAGNANVGIKPDNTLWWWGYTTAGGGNLWSSELSGNTYSWTQIYALGGNAYGKQSDGTWWGGGYGTFLYGVGATGQTDTTHRSSPVQLPASTLDSYTQIVGFSGIAALKSDGTLWTWGDNTYGQNGQNDTVFTTGTRSSPVQVGGSWTMVSSERTEGGPNSYAGWTYGAIKTDSTLWMWGYGGGGALGQNDIAHRSSPVQVGTDSWTMVSCHLSNAVAVKTDGTIWGWGQNPAGQLGLNDLVHRSAPVQIFTGLSSPKAIFCGTSSVFVHASDGTVWAAGSNYDGRLGTNDIISRSSPVQVNATSWETVIFAGSSVILKKSDGTLWGWGSNNVGQLAQRDAFSRSSAVQIGTGSWAMVASNGTNSWGIKDNLLYVWGGQGSTGIPLGERMDGAVSAMSNSSSPVLIGAMPVRANRSSPVQIGVGFSWTDAAAGQYHMAAIRSDGTLWTWGNNTSGELGTGDRIHRSRMIQVGNDTNWSKVFTGYGQTYAIKTDGSLYSWGHNQAGALGLNDVIHRSSPVQIGTSSWSTIGVGASTTIVGGYALALRSDSTLWAWGHNSNSNGSNNLGDNTVIHRSSPVQLAGSWSAIPTELGLGGAAIKTDGTLWVWGVGQGRVSWTGYPGIALYPTAGSDTLTSVYSTLGTSTVPALATWSPVQVVGSWSSIGSTWGLFSSGPAFVGVKTDGTLWAWGELYNHYYQPEMRGNAASTYNTEMTQEGSSFYPNLSRSSPVAVGISPTTGWSNVAVLWNSCFAVKSNVPYVWGGATSIFFGDMPSYEFSARTLREPTRIDSISNNFAETLTKLDDSSWSTITANEYSALGIKSDGTLWGWGRNTQGQLGLGDTNYRSSPVQIGTSSWTQVAMSADGYNRTATVAAIRLDGALFTWGAGSNGALGSGLTTSRSSPVQVGTSSWVSIGARRLGFHAIRSGGSLFGWGYNDYGEIGDGTIAHRSSPVQIGTSSWTVVHSTQIKNGYAIRSDGALFGWGYGNQYGVGDGSTQQPRSSPVQIGGNVSWSLIGSGAMGHEYGSFVSNVPLLHAIKTNQSLWWWGSKPSAYQGFADFFTGTTPRSAIPSTGTWTSVAGGGSVAWGIKLS